MYVVHRHKTDYFRFRLFRLFPAIKRTVRRSTPIIATLAAYRERRTRVRRVVMATGIIVIEQHPGLLWTRIVATIIRTPATEVTHIITVAAVGPTVARTARGYRTSITHHQPILRVKWPLSTPPHL